jgi:hypothetical protein
MKRRGFLSKFALLIAGIFAAGKVVGYDKGYKITSATKLLNNDPLYHVNVADYFDVARKTR